MLGALRRPFPPTIRQLLVPGFSAQKQSAQTQLEVCGWVKSVRRQKNVSFAVVSDGSSSRGLQAVFSKDTIPNGLTNGCSVKLRGQLVESPGTRQEKEFRVETAEIVGECDPDASYHTHRCTFFANKYPIQKQSLTVDYLRDQCHFRARADKIGEMLRIRDCLSRAVHAYFEKEGFMSVHTPIITSSDCEGAGEAFSVSSDDTSNASESKDDTSDEAARHFFRKEAYLTVSSQLHLEALATARSRVYTLAPCFRAERSQTNRHLAEFWMLEAEWAFTQSVEDLCVVVEAVVKNAVIAAIAQEGHEDSELNFRVHATFMLGHPWLRMSYTDAVEKLRIAHAAHPQLFVFAPEWGKGLQSEHEKWLAKEVGGPVFVTDYPMALKPFYMRLNADGQTAACFDLLVPGVGELAGGSLREERLDMLDKAMERHNLLGQEEYGWYMDLRKFGGAPHGGFGLGFERLVSAVSGQPNVRECIAMPRWAGRMLL
ncbi:asparaginyl-tRNA synthetase [Phellopilus nigrolimitatus]|nr:asparaginyl-tRNA synthetase [Phellopilus nigrolimitatus]